MLQACSVKLIYSEHSDTTLSAAGPTHQKWTAPPRCIGKRGVNDLHELSVAANPSHASSIAQVGIQHAC